jgi:hypothetical protein
MRKNSKLHPIPSNSVQVGLKGKADGKVWPRLNKDKSSEHDNTTSKHISRQVCSEKTNATNTIISQFTHNNTGDKKHLFTS